MRRLALQHRSGEVESQHALRVHQRDRAEVERRGQHLDDYDRARRDAVWLRQRPRCLAADANIVIVAGFDMKKTTNGGTTWASVPTAGHVNNHCLRFSYPDAAPRSSVKRMAFRTTNSSTSWTSLNKGLAITQFYRLGLSKLTPTLMVAGAQDNGNMKLNGAIWSSITNADGMGGFIDFASNNNVYATIQYGALFRSAPTAAAPGPASTRPRAAPG